MKKRHHEASFLTFTEEVIAYKKLAFESLLIENPQIDNKI